MQRLTKEQGIILTGYTGFMCCSFPDFHEDVEKRMGQPLLMHEISILRDEIQDLYQDDFMGMMPLSMR